MLEKCIAKCIGISQSHFLYVPYKDLTIDQIYHHDLCLHPCDRRHHVRRRLGADAAHYYGEGAGDCRRHHVRHQPRRDDAAGLRGLYGQGSPGADVRGAAVGGVPAQAAGQGHRSPCIYDYRGDGADAR